ncbi:MAG TPA: sigma 54-interacting transcriptional regulator [Mucilaginibacter sp.]|jgi:transcriptional regulator with GAF, ATPase, and Fis domain
MTNLDSQNELSPSIEEMEKENALLLLLSKDITSCRTKSDIQQIVSERLGRYFQFNEIMLCLDNADGETHTNYIHTITQQTMSHPDFLKGVAMKYYIKDGIYNVIQESAGSAIFDMFELMRREKRPYYVDFFYDNLVRQLIGFPIRVKNESFGAVYIYVKDKRFFTDAQLKLAGAVCSHISIAIANVLAYEKIQNQLAEINKYKSQLEQENIYLQEQIKKTFNYGEIIGTSPALQQVFKLLSNVAPSDSTVLILGETGTGKELIARAIHNASPRSNKLMIKVNCATLPAQLIESELFGHERGSFTGATERRIGKFELADNSTLFLDEIGEMSLDLQVKLLRAIQEREIERVGGKCVIKTNVRLIAATNRDLEAEVDARRFRADLFYRLNVFPIMLPALRERKDDIPLLASYFVNKFANKSRKKVTSIAPQALQELVCYDWPGNVRELEHVIERSILMADAAIIKEVYLRKQNKPKQVTQVASMQSLEDIERNYILEALQKCNGRIRGKGGAAEILDLPPTTLHSKMKKLGINKMHF